MSNEEKKVVVKFVSGTTTEDVQLHIQQKQKRSFGNMIIGIGTNGLQQKEPDNIAKSMNE